MASISSANSLGNTTLRGYGGMASGIDRDAIIEQMTLGTTTKINNQESAITKLEWKQEAYRSISDKILDLYDDFASYTGTNSLKDPTAFAKTLISVLGKEESTRFVTASGLSDLVGSVSIESVRQLASSSVQMSDKRQDSTLNMSMKDLGGKAATYANLMNAQLRFADQNGENIQTFTFATSYTKDDGTVKQINYHPENEEEYQELVDDLNVLLEKSSVKLGSGDKDQIGKVMEFVYEGGKVKIKNKASGSESGPIGSSGYYIQSNSTALAGLGYTGKTGGTDKIDLTQYNGNLQDFEKSVVTRVNTINFLKNEKLTFKYDGSSKEIMLITNDEANQLLNLSLDDDKLQDILGITETELAELKKKIEDAIRADETAGAEEDAHKKIESDIQKEVIDEVLDDLRKELRDNNPELAGLADDDPKMIKAMNEALNEKSPAVRVQEKLIQEAESKGHTSASVKQEVEEALEKEITDKLRAELREKNPELKDLADDDPKMVDALNQALGEKSMEVRMQEVLAAEAAKNGHTNAKVEKEIEEKLRAEIEDSLAGTTFPSDEEKEARIEELLKEKLEEKPMSERVAERQAELAMDDRVKAGQVKHALDDRIEAREATDFEKEKAAALEKRVEQRLSEKSMTARITEQATLAQQDEISKELNARRLEMIKENVQNRLNKAFGTDNVQVDIDGEKLTFKTKKADSSVSVSSTDGSVLYTLGISNGESNKVNTSGTLKQSALGIDINDDKYKDGLVINGVKIGGIDEKTSISTILSKINSSDAGVKATYVAATGQFMLVSEETGSGREINLDSALARDLFGRSDVDADSTVDSMGLWSGDDSAKDFEIGGQKLSITKDTKISDLLDQINGTKNEDGSVKTPGLGLTTADGKAVTASFDEETRSFVLKDSDGKDVTSEFASGMSDSAKTFFSDRNKDYFVGGQDAIIDVSYGNGMSVTMERASNTFDLEGMTVTVSGVFGGEYKKDADGNVITGADGKAEWVKDTSAGVNFSAKADVDKVTEKVKKFFEAFNAIASEINTQVTTRPDSSYGPLTDEQKDEMSETSIENWEKKAKSGLLFNDSTMRDLSMDVQSIYTKLMSQTGLSYEDLKEMGITYSDNEKDGGVLVFDETAFRSAMENKPEKVSALFTGNGGNGKGLIKTVEDTFTPYATRYASRNGNSYGRLIEEAGSEKIPTSIMKNQIYREIKSKQELIEQLRAKLKTEQDRYISQFTTMETMINQMNSQASYLSQITG